MNTLFHPLESSLVEKYPLPEHLNNPFDYHPHPLAEVAAERVTSWLGESAHLSEGKMFGVLIVEKPNCNSAAEQGEIGFLAAFSGAHKGSVEEASFVPQIFDIEQCKPYTDGQLKITQLTSALQIATQSPTLATLQDELAALKRVANDALEELRAHHTAAKSERKIVRQRAQNDPSLEPEEREKLLKKAHSDSSLQKREMREARAEWQQKIEAKESEIEPLLTKIKELKKERSAISVATQQSIFQEFKITSADQQTSSLLSLFHIAKGELPPSGAGECAAPKLLHYALQNGLKPRAMGEFWIGKSPLSEPRHHHHFYTSCMGRCGVILPFMLSGVELTSRPKIEIEEPTILFEDQDIIIFNKPSGMLSVPGKSQRKSLLDFTPGLHTVHRLDMDTSGIIVYAKSLKNKVLLQRQFEERTTHKEYIALLDGHLCRASGRISLPLRPDILDRPRQVVDHQNGREAITDFQLLGYSDDYSRTLFTPLTGRSHQLRLHSAHPAGLAFPILGDRLYGRLGSNRSQNSAECNPNSACSDRIYADRLHLHAYSLTFTHPRTNEVITITCEAPF